MCEIIRVKNIKYLFGNYGNTDLGLLLIRVVFGAIMFFNHGYGKLIGGIYRWNWLGGVLTNLIGYDIFQIFFGLMASLSESIFALFIMLGFLTRISSTLLFITMLVASLYHLVDNEFPEMAILYAVFCLLILVSGPGRHSLDHRYLSKYQ